MSQLGQWRDRAPDCLKMDAAATREALEHAEVGIPDLHMAEKWVGKVSILLLSFF